MPRRTPMRSLKKLRDLKPALTLVLLLVSARGTAAAQSPNADQQAYCSYLTEQAQAQSDLLRTPNGIASFTQPDTGLPTQLVAGATLSVANLKRAGITLDAARKNCELYKASTGVQQTLQYALPSIEKEALTHRLELIARASQSLDGLIDQTTRMVDAQNMTRPMLLELQMTRIKLEADRADTQSKLSAIYVPALETQPLTEQVAGKQSSDAAEQRAQDKLARQNNWDVALTVGAHQQINPYASGAEPYGEITASYNFASRAVDRHLDRSVEAYADWKKVQEGDAVRGMEVLRTQLTGTIAAQQTRLDALKNESQQIEKSLQPVSTPHTTAAYEYRNQLSTTQILLGVEIGDSSFRLERLNDFLKRNY
jgi:hypothetical protein